MTATAMVVRAAPAAVTGMGAAAGSAAWTTVPACPMASALAPAMEREKSLETAM